MNLSVYGQTMMTKAEKAKKALEELADQIRITNNAVADVENEVKKFSL